MLEQIVCNGLETPKGYRNPDHGIPLRGPLSQLFSALYLKPLDDAFDSMDVTTVRYQDDVIILCKTKRQMNRCRRRMMEILHQRSLRLSLKKSRIGLIRDGFHFLGIQYVFTEARGAENTDTAPKEHNEKFLSDSGTQTQRYTIANKAQSSARALSSPPIRREALANPHHAAFKPLCKQRLVHPRTCRNAREQVKSMMASGFSVRNIRTYLLRWARWWVRTVEDWHILDILQEFEQRCFDDDLACVCSRARTTGQDEAP
jgi:hypothetical protein